MNILSLVSQTLNIFYQIQTKCYRNSDTVFFSPIHRTKRGLTHSWITSPVSLNQSSSLVLVGTTGRLGQSQEYSPSLISKKKSRSVAEKAKADGALAWWWFHISICRARWPPPNQIKAPGADTIAAGQLHPLHVHRTGHVPAVCSFVLQMHPCTDATHARAPFGCVYFLS
jgi:hypothetical protein